MKVLSFYEFFIIKAAVNKQLPVLCLKTAMQCLDQVNQPLTNVYSPLYDLYIRLKCVLCGNDYC